jgi:8-oxo-dGTP diphosphatase
MNLDPVARKNFATQAAEEIREAGGIVVVNSDAKLAAMLGAGLHLPSRDLMAAESRPDIEWCSASVHNAAELEKARDLELDFVLLGPVEATPSHSGAAKLGWDRFGDLVRNYSLPAFALGGVRQGDLDEARRRGAHGIAMVRGAWES